MKNFFLYSLMAILVLALTLSGCGGGNNDGPGGGTTYTPGQSSVCTVGGVSFNMHYVPNASFTNDSYFQGKPYLPGPVTVANAYWMAETEVTWELWAAVHAWATTGSDATGAGQYLFQNVGAMGSGTGTTNQHPVTTVNWRDAMVWCNALTEYFNAQNGTSLACVYVDNTSAIIRDSSDSNEMACDNVTAVSTAKGFRLPTDNEWQLAARYQNGTDWTPGNHVSGDTTGHCNPDIPDDIGISTVFGNYAWWWNDPNSTTHPVGGKTPNALKLRDMSGNVYEWCFDHLFKDGELKPERMLRGGSYGGPQYFLQLGVFACDSPTTKYPSYGFRPVRTE